MTKPYKVERTLVGGSKEWLTTSYSTLDKAMAAAKFWEQLRAMDGKRFYVRISHSEQGILYPSAPIERGE